MGNKALEMMEKLEEMIEKLEEKIEKLEKERTETRKKLEHIFMSFNIGKYNYSLQYIRKLIWFLIEKEGEKEGEKDA